MEQWNTLRWEQHVNDRCASSKTTCKFHCIREGTFRDCSSGPRAQNWDMNAIEEEKGDRRRKRLRCRGNGREPANGATIIRGGWHYPQCRGRHGNRAEGQDHLSAIIWAILYIFKTHTVVEKYTNAKKPFNITHGQVQDGLAVFFFFCLAHLLCN